jgi:lipopolysaccharide/colanic/teichoic acid biosynthesis glycosyltransferase
MTSNIFLTTSKVLTLDLDNAAKSESYLPSCTLKWRKKILWVTEVKDNLELIPALKRQKWLQDCLNNSLVRTVCLDSRLGEKGIKAWADACRQAKKQVFLRINSSDITHRHNRFCWRIKRVLDWNGALALLLLLSPIIIAIAISVKLSSPGEILFRQWRVGRRGKLFQIYKFRTMNTDAEHQHHAIMGNCNGLHKLENDPRITSLGKWLRKYSLDELPQLFNVLRGEMSLVGPRPWALYDALRLGEMGKDRLNALPGITGAWQVESRSRLLDLNAVTKCDLEYLHRWSLMGDLKILLLTIPKVISGFGAY